MAPLQIFFCQSLSLRDSVSVLVESSQLVFAHAQVGKVDVLRNEKCKVLLEINGPMLVGS